ncbi:MAG: PilZ domain-containing protein [Acidimicrobiales bacterium]
MNRRLLPRYRPATEIRVDWLVAARTTGLVRRRTLVPQAVVIDVSVNGMLLEAPSEPPVEPGSIITVGSDGEKAVARVIHRHVTADPERMVVGIDFTTMSPTFAEHLHAVVGALRGDRGELERYWVKK